MSIEDAYNFRRIDDRVTTSGLVSVDQLGDLGREGYGAVVNLLPDSYEHAVADEGRIVQEQGLDYVYIPVDFDAPTPRTSTRSSRRWSARSEQRVHVHSAANWRVSAFYSLYALRTGRCSEAEADQLVRDVWDPADFPAWTTFMAEERARSLP